MVDRPLEAGVVEGGPVASLFDQVPGVYAFCREHLFRDDTERIATALWPSGEPPRGAVLLELGCGPGFYARRLAARFAGLRVIGLDRSRAQLERATARLARADAGRCRFDLGDATALPYRDQSVDAVVSSRLLAAVDDPTRVLAEAYRVLRPGGRYFVAEPRSSIRAAVPIGVMRFAAHLEAVRRGRPAADADRVTVLDGAALSSMLRLRPWRTTHQWVDGSYRYALLEKDGRAP
jgi:arsenite methyltransferase